MTDRQVSKKVHDRARLAAIKDLIDNHRGEYDVLRAGWVEHYKIEFGWTDERPTANRTRDRSDQPRGPRGHWNGPR